VKSRIAHSQPSFSCGNVVSSPIACMPAACAAWMPGRISSKTRHFAAGRFNCFAAFRNLPDRASRAQFHLLALIPRERQASGSQAVVFSHHPLGAVKYMFRLLICLDAQVSNSFPLEEAERLLVSERYHGIDAHGSP
jgi:hypothetical protein